MKEANVERHLCQRWEELGGEVRKVKWIGRVGAPDRLLLMECSEPALVELKRPGEVPEEHQLREHARLRRFGFKVFVVDSIEAVDRLIHSLL